SEFKHGFTSNGRENKVSMFDPTTLQLINKIEVGKGPDGIYYDPGTKRIFTNNHGSHDITAIDAKTGQVIGTVKVEGDGESAVVADGVVYVNMEDTNEVVVFDPQSKLVFFSCSEGVLSVFHEKSADNYEDAGPVKTQPSARTMAFDPKTKKIFLSAAEYIETPPTTPGGRPQRSLKPGSFAELVVSK